ncbi:MAG: zinc ribbon domain-containing protein [Ruminococcus sp.]|nr:zinc ribbon domain-containing protein [Ruminococcus sp.]
MGFKETVFNFAEKVGDTVDKGINMGKESYNKMSEKSRIKKEINRLNTEINNIFVSVGRKLYTEDRENERFKTVFGDVASKESEIAELKNQLSILEGAVSCPSCGAVVQKDDAVCPTCGANIVVEPQNAEVEIVEAEKVSFCSQCGTKLDDNAKFCNQCGNKVAD